MATVRTCRQNVLLLASLGLGLALFAPGLCSCLDAADPAGPAVVAEKDSAATLGIDLSTIGDDLNPGDDFYKYSNQKWLAEAKIPADKSDYGIFSILNDATREKVRTLIERAAAEDSEAGSAAQKVGDLYNSVLNLDARNDAGIEPVEPLLASIKAVDSGEELFRVMGELSQFGVAGPIGAYINNDAKDSDSYAVYMTQSGLSLPDRDYYLKDDERYVEARKSLLEYLSDLLTTAGVEDPATAAKSVLKLETDFAERQWTKTQNRDPNETYNKKTVAEIVAMMKPVPIREYLTGAGLGEIQTAIIRQPSYFETLSEIYEQGDLPSAKHYLMVRVLDGYASSLTEALEKRHFAFHGTAITGVLEQEPQWKRAVNTTSGVLGELVGQLYVEENFKPIAKQRMNELVENLKRAFAKRIQTRDWMGQGTKKQALKKLSKFTTKIGYPDKWKDFSNLEIASEILAENMLAAAKFEHQREINKLGGPIDRSEWYMTPQTINAYYNPVMNEIVFPAAILQPPFFNLEADDAANYGAIGAVIGHELSHGFDDKGSEYDGDGNLKMWWTQEDQAEFKRRAAGLVEQYNQYEPVPGNFVQGELTLGENIGDLGGLNVALEAYRLSLGEKEAPVIAGLTGQQRFFLGWGQIWRRLYRKPELLKRLNADPHSPSQYRVNGIVRNMDAWYEAFGIKPEDPMYLAPEDRVRIW
ncbi:MAG: M13 family metallopeptidase [Planctomycetota bacterium]